MRALPDHPSYTPSRDDMPRAAWVQNNMIIISPDLTKEVLLFLVSRRDAVHVSLYVMSMMRPP
jgi:hypothetical protein